MNLHQWNRAHPAPGKQPRHRDGAPQTVVARWNGAQTLIIIEALPIFEQFYLTFRLANAPDGEAFVVGADASAGDDFGNTDKHADAFGFSNAGALMPFPFWPTVYPDWLANAIACVERGWWGRLSIEATKDSWGSGAWLSFFAATGILTREYKESSVIVGMMMTPGFDDLTDPNYDPELHAAPWCDATDARDLLLQLDGAQLAQWLREQQADATTPAGFAHAWKSWPRAERRSWLPPLEREMEDEICRAMKWVYWSAPELKRPEDFPVTPRRKQQWFRPRFIVAPDADAGAFFLWARFCEPKRGEKLNQLETRLRAFWPLIARAFATERAQLEAQRAALPPSVAHWCFRRGCYAVTFEAPTHHEQIESRAALRDWLRLRAKVELEVFERGLPE